MSGVNIIRNGSFTKTKYVTMGTPDPVLFFNEWDWTAAVEDADDGYWRCVASRTYDEEAYEVCCKINVQSTSRSFDYAPGMRQYLRLSNIKEEMKLNIDFYARNLNNAPNITVILLQSPKVGEAGTSKFFDSKKVSISTVDWSHVEVSFTIVGGYDYLLHIEGEHTEYVDSEGEAHYEWSPHEYEIRNVNSNLEYNHCPYTDIIVNGDFESNLPSWKGQYAEISSYKTASGENNKCMRLYKSEEDTGIIDPPKCIGYFTQTITIPESFYGYTFDKYDADLVFSIKSNTNDTEGDYVVTASVLSEGIGEYFESGEYSTSDSYFLEKDSSSWKKITLEMMDRDIWGKPMNLIPQSYDIEFSVKNSAGVEYPFDVLIDDVQFNIYTKCISFGEGTFENPYTINDGRLVYSLASDNKNYMEFRFYGYSFSDTDYPYPPENSFVRIDNTYYVLGKWNEIITSEGPYTTIDEKEIFILPGGRIPVAERFIYDNKVYQADKNGAYTYLCEKLSYINVLFKNNIVNERIIEAPLGVITFELEFPEQDSPVTIDVSSQYDYVVKDITVVPGIKSNTVRLTTDCGEDTLSISYVNVDGSKVETQVHLRVVEGKEYEEEISLNISPNVHYVAVDSSLAIPYVIRPNLASTITIDWLSSDESVALVDVFGNVKPRKVGTCEIKAISYSANISDTCTVHVVKKLTPAASILLSDYDISLGISDSIVVEPTVLSASGTLINVNQEVRWESENSSIATVNRNGLITGVGEGTTNINCYSYDDNTVKSIVKVSVSGETTAIKEIELNMYETMLDYKNPNSYEYIGWTLIPYNTNQTEVIWSSSDPSTVQVAINGRLSIGESPHLNTPVAVKCTSVSNPEIYRECFVTVVDKNYLPTITIKQNSVRTYVGKTITINYGVTQGYSVDAELTDINGNSSNNSLNKYNNHVEIQANQSGEYILTLSYSSANGIAKKTCEIIIYEADEEPQFIKDVELLHTFQNGSYILRYFALDSDDDLNLKHYVCVDNEEDFFESIKAEVLLYDGEEYQYAFGTDLKAGPHTIKVKVVDVSGYETVSEDISLIIPNNDDNKTTLKGAKESYDSIKIDLINHLNEIIEDVKMSLDDKREFTTRYKLFNVGYENLLEILDHCVKHINSQIEASQSEMATIAEGLASDGVAVATYSEGDYTNSNFDSVTDMDYYQNECIKALVQRILILEARLDELTNNNNN
jgi:hypothetical protein